MNIPKYSQHLDVKDKNWKNRACGIIALKTVMELYKQDIPPADKLIKEGLKLDAYLEGIGWKHKGLVKISQKFGFYSQNFDWYKLSSEKAFVNLKEHFSNYPIIASIYKNLDPKEESGHLVVITNIEGENITYYDPDSKDRNSIKKIVDKETFLNGWKRRVVVVKPQSDK